MAEQLILFLKVQSKPPWFILLIWLTPDIPWTPQSPSWKGNVVNKKIEMKKYSFLTIKMKQRLTVRIINAFATEISELL